MTEASGHGVRLWIPAALSLAASPGSAQDFFQGKQIRIVVGSAPGGGYDAYARLLSRYWAKHIPGEPKIIVHTCRAPAASYR